MHLVTNQLGSKRSMTVIRDSPEEGSVAFFSFKHTTGLYGYEALCLAVRAGSQATRVGRRFHC
jgi:hypothetical protein